MSYRIWSNAGDRGVGINVAQEGLCGLRDVARTTTFMRPHLSQLLKNFKIAFLVLQTGGSMTCGSNNVKSSYSKLFVIV